MPLSINQQLKSFVKPKYPLFQLFLILNRLIIGGQYFDK